MSGLEIERVWILRSMPALPQGAECWRLEQGYLPQHTPGDDSVGGFPEGRLRRIVTPDGGTAYRHTVKRGSGLIREEVERSIDEAEFERWWPETAGRRIAKTRHRVSDHGLVWEIDQFDALPLIMAEVELPSPAHEFRIPEWLSVVIEREVTDDPRYRNAALALRGLPT